MKFRFCGNGDCPDWILAEINTLSRLSSLKLKLLGQIVARGLIEPPVEMEKAQKIFSESQLDSNVDLKACIACLSYIIFSTIRYNCDNAALFTELQQLGLPREHSLSLTKIVSEHGSLLTAKLKSSSLYVNRLQKASIELNQDTKTASLHILVNNKNETLVLSPRTIDVLIENLKQARSTMVELVNSS